MLILFFAGFILFIIALVAIDLGVIHRRQHVIGVREALLWSGVWVSLALVFNVLVYFLYGHNWLGFTDAYTTTLTGSEAAKQFLAGYIVELSLSMDNLFVFATILFYFRVPLILQHRVLVWGILGAIVLRGLMIALGAALIASFHWIMYVFGALLILTAIRMLMPGGDVIQPERNIFIRLARKLYPVTAELHGNKFFVRVKTLHSAAAPDDTGAVRTLASAEETRVVVESNPRRRAFAMTPMFLSLILVDVADVIFAVDSIPAIFGVTSDTFIVFTSNIFAILGLRSMYFALVGLMDRFRYLKPAIVLLLAFIGVKMLLHAKYPISIEVSLAVIGGVLLLGIVASLLVSPTPVAESDIRSE